MLPVIQIGFFNIYTFQIILGISFYICYLYLLFAKPYHWLHRKSHIYTMIWALVLGAAGGKMLSAFTMYVQDNGKSFFYHLTHSGSVFYGILVTGFCTAYIVSKKYRIDFSRYASEVAEVLPLGQAIGRIGCFMNGCCYGREYDGPMGMLYPVGNEKIKVFPTWFVESFVCLALFLFFRKKRFEQSRYSFLVYFIVYGNSRFFIEFMRGDDIRGIYGGISTSQIISIVLTLSSMCYLFFINTKRRKFYEAGVCEFQSRNDQG